jgi:cytochrome c oxidase subunit 3
MYRGSFWLFILAESFGFLALFAIRFLLAGTGRPADLNGALAGLVTLIFAVSAVAAAGSLRAISRGDGRVVATRLGLAFGLGLVALVLVVTDWATSPVAPASRFGGAYFGTTGFHAVHIVVGLLFLGALWSAGRRGRFGAGDHWLVEAGVRFWLFVVAAWAALYVVFYWL